MSGRPTIVDLHIAGVGAARLVRTDGNRLLYRAPHETRGHDVDVEILLGSRGEAARERFAREQQALARLAGVEGVVPLLEAGVTVDGDLYLMTQALGGRTLTEIRAHGAADLATLSVPARQIRSMTRTSGTGTSG